MVRLLFILVATLGAAPAFADALCPAAKFNLQGTANADITIDATATGIAVLAADATRCKATIRNSGTADMRCADTSITVSATAGKLVKAGEELILDLESRLAWKCIRTGASSTTADVTEAVQ